MKTGLPSLIIGLIAAQIVCAVVFLLDALADLSRMSVMDWHLVPEALASLALFAGIAFQFLYLKQLLQRKATAWSVASGWRPLPSRRSSKAISMNGN